MNQFIDFDGYFARLLKQTSSLGSWLDVIIDNLGRGILWVNIHQVSLERFSTKVQFFSSDLKKYQLQSFCSKRDTVLRIT
jgi:phosphatidylglycerophosphate synthase